MLSIAATIYFSALAFFLARSHKNHQLENYIPSLAWCCLSVIPFLALERDFLPAYIAPQAIGIFSFAFALLFADSASPRSFKTKESFTPKPFLQLIALIAIVAAVAIQSVHIALMPKIPLIEVWRGGAKTLVEQSDLRELSSKLLKVPLGSTYLFQFSWSFLAPIGIILLTYLGRFKSAAGAFLITALYSRITLARGPIFILFALVLIGTIHLIDRKWRKSILGTGLVLALIVATPITYFFINTPYSILNYRSQHPEAYSQSPIFTKNPEYVPSFTINDHYRELLKKPDYLSGPKWQQSANYCLYRIFLVPIEVAHRWYHYFPKIHGGFLGLHGLTLESRSAPDFQHPANVLGMWAYHSRFPESYTETIRAYTSADADAYSRWGLYGIFLMSLLTALSRWLLAYFRLPGSWGAGINRAALILFGLSLPLASLQATLITQGIGCYLIVMIFFHLTSKFSRN